MDAVLTRTRMTVEIIPVIRRSWKLVKMLGIAGGLLTTLSFFGCGENQGANAFDRPPAPVVVSVAIKEDVPVYLDSIGKIVAREVVSIKPQVSGRITAIHFSDGATVRKGEPLFTIDPRPYEARVHSAEATLAQKEAALNLAHLEFERAKDLVKTEVLSQQAYDSAESAVQIAEAELKQSKADLETAKLNLDYCFIRSPISGRTGQRLVDLGNTVTDDDNLLSIQNLDPIYAEFTIAESDLTSVQEKMKGGSLKVEVRLPDEDKVMKEGVLTFLDNAVQKETGTVKLRATVPNADGYFWPGRFVDVRLILNIQKGAILIPSDAPQMSPNGSYVYVIKGDSTAELRLVKLGQQQSDQIVVREGLQEGERVVISGQLGVIPDQKVKVEETRWMDESQKKETGEES